MLSLPPFRSAYRSLPHTGGALLALTLVVASCSTDPVADLSDTPATSATTTSTTEPSPSSTDSPGSAPTSAPDTQLPDGTDAPSTTDGPPPPTVTPPIPGGVEAPGMVAFVDAEGQIVLDRPATSALDPGRVSPPFTLASQPTWAPDGEQLAWLSFGANDRLAKIQLFNLTDGPYQTLTPTFVPFYLSWSPASDNLGLLGGNGTSILFGFSQSQDINVVPPSDQGEQYYFSWIPDENTVLSFDGMDVSQVSSDDDASLIRSDSPFQSPVVLADRTAIISVPDSTAGQVVARINLDTGDVTPLASHAGQVFLVGSPDGTELAVVQVPQTGGGPAINPISFQPDGTVPELAMGLSVIDLASGEITEPPITGVEAVFYSPDSSRLLVQATDEQTQWHVLEGDQIVLTTPGFIPTPTFNQTVLPFFDQYAQSMTPWAPDGSAFVYARMGDGVGEIIVQSSSDGRSQVLGQGEYAAWSPTEG